MDLAYKPNHSCQIRNIAQVYETLFGGVKVGGSFIEVGAYDGIEWSNTDFLARDLDWQGIYVEPMLHLAQECGRNHAKNDVWVISKVISDHEGFDKLYISEGISHTVEPKVAGMANPFGDPGEKFNGSYLEVECETLNKLFIDSFEIVGMSHVDLLVIDVEGAEMKILNPFNIYEFRPSVVIVEVNQYSGNIIETDAYFLRNGYRKFQYDGLNAIYHI